MKSVIVLSYDKLVNCPQCSISVQHCVKDFKLLKQMCQLVSPRFTVDVRPWYPDMDKECVGFNEALVKIQEAVLVYVDKYNYGEITTWHVVEDGEFTYEKFKNGIYKVSKGVLYRAKKEFQRVPLKYTIRNVADGSYKTIERF